MVLLQTPPFTFFTAPDPATNRIAVAVFAAIVVAVVAASIASRRRTPGSRSARGLRRTARRMGLDRNHIEMLYEMVRTLRPQNSMRLLSDPDFLTAAVRRMVRRIDGSAIGTAEKEARKALVFQLKQRVTVAQTGHSSVSSTRQLQVGREIRISTDGHTWLESAVKSNAQGSFAIEVPYDSRGRDVLLDRGTTVMVAFTLDSDGKLFRLKTRVAGITRSRRGSSLLLAHSDKIDQSQKRRFPRREFDRPAMFWPIDVVTVGTGRKAKKQAVINKYRRHLGQIEEISAGGCSIRSSTPLASGTLLKIEFETVNRERLAVFGKVRAIDRVPSRFGIMHVMFTRVTRANLNRIQAFVYGVDSGRD
ncbi:MAG: PilZ domain-containing protein [Spirochaetaceae bacterium]|nr:MAG: PilZ domain-containing protein [Spirochaetaceae bacterium]